MTLTNALALFTVMLIGALVPSVSVFTVTARSAASGFIHGAFTTCGIVLGDIIFIIVAIFGLSLLVNAMGNLFVYVNYLAGAYLIWVGSALWRTRSASQDQNNTNNTSLLSSFVAGLLITLADQKAILFYFGLLPAVLDLASLSLLDAGIIIALAIVAVGGAKIFYAAIASKTGALIDAKLLNTLNITASCVLIATGIFVIAKKLSVSSLAGLT